MGLQYLILRHFIPKTQQLILSLIYNPLVKIYCEVKMKCVKTETFIQKYPSQVCSVYFTIELCEFDKIHLNCVDFRT